ncbi:MAG: hypothetical protein KC535_03335 [Nanoarchaeota archaeon]|nr:hypothetical protein [Nanoarchaeota archaeon]
MDHNYSLPTLTYSPSVNYFTTDTARPIIERIHPYKLSSQYKKHEVQPQKEFVPLYNISNKLSSTYQGKHPGAQTINAMYDMGFGR